MRNTLSTLQWYTVTHQTYAISLFVPTRSLPPTTCTMAHIHAIDLDANPVLSTIPPPPSLVLSHALPNPYKDRATCEISPFIYKLSCNLCTTPLSSCHLDNPTFHMLNTEHLWKSKSSRKKDGLLEKGNLYFFQFLYLHNSKLSGRRHSSDIQCFLEGHSKSLSRIWKKME